MGADRAVLVSDEGAAGSDLLATSYALAKALERESADLVLFGQQSSDSDGAVLWAAVAERLRRPMISQAAELKLEGGSVTGKRQTEFGYDVIRAPPAGGRRRRRRDQRAALPVAEGDHGREEEAAGRRLARRSRRRGRARRASRARAPRCSRWAIRRRAATRARSRTTARRRRRSSSSSRRSGSL